MTSPAVIILFGIACAEPCGVDGDVLRALEAEMRAIVSKRGYTVKPAPADTPRPTGRDASPDPIDVASALAADRVIVPDLEAGGATLWITHFLRGVRGPWTLERALCRRREESFAWRCGALEAALVSGLRPRTALDVDLVSMLRARAPEIDRCVKESDRAPLEDRTFGKVEMDVEIDPSGAVRVSAIAPALVATRRFGQCLRDAIRSANVGPFEGEPMRVRVPIDL